MDDMNQMLGFNVVFSKFIDSVNKVNNGFKKPIQSYTYLYDTVSKVLHGVYRQADYVNSVNIEIKIEDNEILTLKVKNDSGYNSVVFFKDGDVILMLELSNGDIIDGLFFPYREISGKKIANYLLDIH
jgi:hypothetical protein